MSGDHDHDHSPGPDQGGHGHEGHGHAHGVDGTRRLLSVVLAMNLAFLVVEVVGGLRYSSLALLADAAHMISDVAGLTLALVAQSLLLRPPSGRHTFGLVRSEVLAGQANGLLTAGAGIWVVVEGLRRIGDPRPVQGAGVIAVALVGLAVNLISVRLLFGARHDNLNMRGAFIHMMSDAAGSVAAAVAGLAAWLGSAYWVDPVASVVIGALVVWTAWGLLRSTTHVLLEGAPPHVSSNEIVTAVTELPEVTDVHHLHLWFLASSSVALSGHVVLRGEPTLHQAQQVGDQIRSLLGERFGIRHATLELECHNCEDADDPERGSGLARHQA